MARICITGSSNGIGFLAAQSLLAEGHEVILHARSAARADELRAKLPAARHIVTGDLSLIAQMRSVAEQVNRVGRCDAVIHNAGVYGNSRQQAAATEDGLPPVFAVNTLAPYVLTALIERPQRLIYLSSSMHLGASADLSDLGWQRREWSASAAYSESKLWLTVLAMAVARLWPQVHSNAVDPGWVPTNMGGPSAPDDLTEGYQTQTWLAVSRDEGAGVSGKYFYHRQQQSPDERTLDESKQTALLAHCQSLSGIDLARS